MGQRIIKRILALSMVGIMAFSLAACSNNQDMSEPNDIEDTPTINEPSESQPTQEVETTPTPTPSEEPTPGQDTTPMPNEDEPSEAMPSQEPTSSEPTSTQEPITTQEPTQSQEPIQTQTPTTTTTQPPTTQPTSTPIHTHSFKGGNCSTPSICECGEIGTYGDHNWTTQENGHYEQVQVGTQEVVVGREQYWIIECRACHAHFYNTDDLNWHQDPNNPDALVRCWDVGSDYYSRHRDIIELQPIYEDKWVVDTITTICSICGATQ